MNQKIVYLDDDGNIEVLNNQTVAIVGYGNQGRSQALNLRDSGVKVIIGNIRDEYRKTAEADGFEVFEISQACTKADIIFLLLPDEILPDTFANHIKNHLKKGNTLCFASGYNIAFKLIDVPKTMDVIMIAPRMIGVGVRETYLSGEGFYSFIGVEQDATGNAKSTLLGLTKALGSLKKGAIYTTFKQEAVLDLFNEQAFGPAFGRVLLTAISTLINNGLPSEAVLIEMYMSGEMSYTYQKMAQIGLIKQTDFHSHTSQYGSMSRGARYLGIAKEMKKQMQRTFDEINSGSFAKEWKKPFSKLKFKVIKFFATRQKINILEKHVRKSLNLIDYQTYQPPSNIEELLKKPKVKNELEILDQTFEF
jgi:ketol-acid reductoisomerase